MYLNFFLKFKYIYFLRLFFNLFEIVMVEKKYFIFYRIKEFELFFKVEKLGSGFKIMIRIK